MEWASHRAGLVPTRCSQGKQCLLSSKKIGSGAFSKVYLAYATQERMRHNSKLASDLRGKRHTMVRQARLLPTGWGFHSQPQWPLS